MTTRARDRLVAAIAVVVLVALAAAVVGLVLDAQHSGIETREDFRLEQIRTEAARMELQVVEAFESFQSFYGAPGTFTMELRSPEDTALLAPRNPNAESGAFLLDPDKVIVSGVLLRDEGLIGQPYEREGVDEAIDSGGPAILAIGPGLTTSRPTIALTVPTRDDAGNVAGLLVYEVEVVADSLFNEQISLLRTGDTGGVSFVDQNGIVVASNDEALLGEQLESDEVLSLDEGFHRAAGMAIAIAEVPSPGWRTVFLQDLDEFEGDITGPLQLALLLFLGVVGIAGTVAVVALLRRLAAAREEQRRLEEIGHAREEFTSIVSHELRTPVAGLLGFLQTTIDHWEAMGDDERRRAVGRAFTNARSLQALTTDVLDSASIEATTMAYRFQPIDIRSCVSDAVEQLADASPERPVNVTQPGEPLTVNADPLRLRQVLTNLLDNATKSSAPDSPIDIDVTSDGDRASISVRDRGAGLASDERDRIFDKFTRGRVGIGRGSGLGLYISRHIVEAHGGTISASSTSGEAGARFTFTIPLHR
jgi:signal transduction histidine kinase